MAISTDLKHILFWLIGIFAILGAILLAVALFDPTTDADRTAMGCFGIGFTNFAIIMLAVLLYDR